MTRQDFAWIVVRALGVITFWLLVINIIGLLLYTSLTLIAACPWKSSGPNPLALFEAMLRNSMYHLLNAIIYSGLTYYLLRKANYAYSLIVKNIPTSTGNRE